MAEERAIQGHPFWRRRWGLFPTPGRRYLDWRYARCRPWIAGLSVLDAPSGEGLGLPLLRAAREIICLDYDAEAVARAKSQAANVTASICADMTRLPFADGHFEAVVSLEGLEHLHKSQGVRFLAEVHRVLPPGGRFLLSCPLCVGGRHSGNEFHLHEWDREELAELLDFGFAVDAHEERNFIGPVAWYALVRRAAPLTAHDWSERLRSQAADRLASLTRRVRNWLRQVWTEPLAPLHATGRPHLMPTCFAVLAAETSGELDELPPTRREAIAAAITARQLDDGQFDPGSVRLEDLTSHPAEYLRWQTTYFAIHALDALGRRPARRIARCDELRDPTALRRWLVQGSWHNSWQQSNNVMFALTCLQVEHERSGDPDSLAAIDYILAYLDERQDSETGLWQPEGGRDAAHALYAAYHFFPYYFWRGRQPAGVERIIDATLGVQKHDGLFGLKLGGGACEDLDAAHTLVMMSLVSEHRAAEVRLALERCFWRILQTQRSDGGFVNSVRPVPAVRFRRRAAEALGIDRLLRRPRPGRIWYQAGWRQLACPQDASDMWSAWFRPLVLRLIADRYPDLAGPVTAGRYRSLPGLGWHDSSAIRAARKNLVAADGQVFCAARQQ